MTELGATPSGDASASDRTWTVAVTALCVGFVLLGLAARIAPLFDRGGRLLQQYPTEDAYLMLTVARNLALGHGMSVSDGTIPSNGVQPLAMFLWAACFWLVEGVKRTGVALVLALELFLSAVGALGLERLGRLAFAGTRKPALAAALAASAWWASPVTIAHSMNGLETQIYAASVVLAALSFIAPGTQRAWSWQRQLGFGLSLGICFLARNDAMFFILGACLVHLARPIEGAGPAVTRRFSEALVFGAVSVAVAAPWLVFNYLGFGSIVPISGQSEAMDAHFAQNLGRVPTVLLEFALLVAPIPRRLQDMPAVTAAASLACVLLALAAVRLFRACDPTRRALVALGVFFTVSLGAFYGLYFGAGYFMERYLYPASPFLALAWGWAVVELCARHAARGLGWHGVALSVGAFALSAAGAVHAYRTGDSHMHFQVVRWVEANVPPDVWVGAGQTGTLGFFHDRTINFDGKVNPEALEARKRGELIEYIAKKRLPYIADWVGAVDFMREPPIRARYEILVNDPEKNLGVLRLRKPAEADAPERRQPPPDATDDDGGGSEE